MFCVVEKGILERQSLPTNPQRLANLEQYSYKTCGNNLDDIFTVTRIGYGTCFYDTTRHVIAKNGGYFENCHLIFVNLQCHLLTKFKSNFEIEG